MSYRGILTSAAAFFVILCASCQEQSTWGPVESIRGLRPPRLGESTVLKEDDHCLLVAVDGHPVPDHQTNVGDEKQNTAFYRQFEIPPGHHIVEVRYFKYEDPMNGNYIGATGGGVAISVNPTTWGDEPGAHKDAIQFPVTIELNHFYSLKSNEGGPLDHWHPELLDADSGQSAGKLKDQ